MCPAINYYQERSYRIHSVSIPATHPTTTINTTAEYNTSATESTKDPKCPATSTTINTTAEYNTSATETTRSVKDPMCPATSTTINTTAEYNTSATESTVSANTTEGVCDPKKDPTCPAVNYY
ncbi:uncharacterized protein [Macrobrachium rosenbergii]|uniref:uncharacterized protein n=1 Tax=Macrobrachium rosenbergii TaxID=79674 RepID=UPI0034D67D13